MTLEVTTTTVTIRRHPTGADEADPWDGWDPDNPTAATTVVQAGVRAAFVKPKAQGQRDGGLREKATWGLLLDPCDLLQNDVVVDDHTQVAWTIETVEHRVDAEDPSMDHVIAAVYTVTGEV